MPLETAYESEETLPDEDRVLDATQPPFAVQSRNVRSRESVQTWPSSVGCGLLATERISDPTELEDCRLGKYDVSAPKNELGE
jgi:hypothetical protein